MKAILNQYQLSNFLAGVWNDSQYKGWAELASKELWGEIIKLEMSRTFQHGWQYCRSILSIEAPHGAMWHYVTTSGTEILINQQRESSEDELQIEVTIPNSREGGTHHGWLKRCLNNEIFYSWGEKFYSTPNTPEYAQALAEGMIPECDEPPKEKKHSSEESVEVVEEEFDDTQWTDEELLAEYPDEE